MQVIGGIDEMRLVCRRLRASGADRTLALVPTMGALHAGHRALVRAARASCDAVVVSIFVNPLQFGPSEDYGRYPRAMEQDCRMLKAEQVDVVFAPSVEEMYPRGASMTSVDVPEIAGRLDGASRPGHFRGVATVVSKLFNIVGPDRAFFGQKDAAQLAVLRTMVRDLNMPVALVECPTVRDADGLALSSRNAYLSVAERETALALPRSLAAVERAIEEGENSAPVLKRLLRASLERAPGVRVDYAEIVDPETLEVVDTVSSGALVAVAAWVGSTRLIDNVLVGGSEAPR